MASIHQDAVAPYAFQYTLSSTDFDLNTTSAAVFTVKYSNGTERTWTAATSGGVGLPSSSIIVSRTFAAGDLDIAGTARIVPVLTLPVGEVVGPPQELFIREVFS
jgi:hypothetical protein